MPEPRPVIEEAMVEAADEEARLVYPIIIGIVDIVRGVRLAPPAEAGSMAHPARPALSTNAKAQCASGFAIVMLPSPMNGAQQLHHQGGDLSVLNNRQVPIGHGIQQ